MQTTIAVDHPNGYRRPRRRIRCCTDVLRRALTCLAAAATLVAASGCSGAEGLRAQELLLQAQQAETQLRTAAFEAGLSFTLAGQKVEVLLEGAGSKRAQYVSMSANGLPGAAFDLGLVVRGDTAWLRMNGGWQRMPVPADVDVGGSASLGSAAFQELTKHVEDVRVSEHQLVNGKPVTIIAGEVDTVGLLGSVSKLASLSGSAPEGMQLPDFEQLGAKIGDIRAVLTIDEGTHLLSSAIVKLSVEAAGEQLDVELRYRLTAANEPVRIPSPSA
jgi:hypothetical protein